MKLILATTILLLSFLAPQSVSTAPEPCVRKLESDCYYVAQEKYKRLEEFKFFWTGDVKGRRQLSISGKAYVNGAFINLKGMLKDDRLTFVTSKSQGFTYRFIGRFIRGGQTVKGERINIRGRLIKFNGSRTVLLKVNFSVGTGYNASRNTPFNNSFNRTRDLLSIHNNRYFQPVDSGF